MAEPNESSDELTEVVAGIVTGQATARAAIVEGTAAGVVALWATFGEWYSTRAIGELSAQSVKLMRAGKRQTASLTNAYITRTAAATAGGKRRPAARLVDVDALRLDPFTGEPMTPAVLQHVAGRPADRYRFERAQRANKLEALLQRRSLDEVAEQALEADRARYTVEALRETRSLEFDDTEFRQLATERAESIVTDELALAHRHQARKTGIADSRITGWRRVLHPELSTSTGVCGLCIAASDRTYSRGDLQAIHTGCNCEPVPIVDGRDPGQELNAADLTALYDIAGSTYAADLLRVRVKVAEHGELGPALVAFNADPKSAPQVRKHTARQRRPGSGDDTPDQEDDDS